MPNIQQLLDKRVKDAMRAAFPEAAEAPAIVMPSQDPKFGDYQANGAMGLAKSLKRKPRDVAAAIVEKLEVSDLVEPPEIAGPGFINLRLRPEWVVARLGEANSDDRLGVPQAEKPETVVVDYSAPNLAKEMHVGHLRSTIIGDALVRMLDFAGHKIVKQNHVGDWGTQFGMLVAYMKDKMGARMWIEPPSKPGAYPRLLHNISIPDLEVLYQQAKACFDGSPEFAELARKYVVRLQTGDPDTYNLWMYVVEISLSHAEALYDRLGVTLRRNDVCGESAYNDILPDIIEALNAKGLLTESRDAQCVFLPEFKGKDGEPLPLIVQKSDEGYLYATTDLAAIAFRTGHLPGTQDPESKIRNDNSPRAARILYVVDARQSLHFSMVFAVARKAGFAPPETALVHVAFGTMMGPDGRPFRTREGGTVKLMALLEEAEARALDLVGEKSPGLSEEERRRVAHIVGIGAVKYFDLSQNRTSDYVFDWDRMLSLQGNTAPYMQYAYARVRSIFRKGGEEAATRRNDAAPIPLAAPEELALAKMVLRFSETLARALEDYRPNVLAAYLYDLAGAFTTFYEACPVLKSEGPLRGARLKLCDLTARTVKKGLDLLGIETAERM